MSRKVKILDSTLREGEQTPGVYFPIHVKIAIAEVLEEIGVDMIEAGHPAVTPQVKKAVAELSKRNFNVLIGAHSRSLKEDVELALECGVDFIGLFYCVSEERLNHYGKRLNEVIEQIGKVISYIREKSPEIVIRYTPEDTVRSPWKNVLSISAEAVRAGAQIISVADTTGYMVPGTERSMYDFVSKLKDELGKLGLFPEIAVHCHNDRGLALANALDGFRAGADIIDASVMGLGERAGIVDLGSLLAVFSFDFSIENNWNLKKLSYLYRMVSNFSGIPVPVNFPVTGRYAFTHCAGVHTHAVLKNPVHYQSLSSEVFGRKPEVALDHMAGMSSLEYSLQQIGEENLDRSLLKNVLAYVKDIGQTGRTISLEELRLIVNYIQNKEGGRRDEDRDHSFPFEEGRKTLNRRI